MARPRKKPGNKRPISSRNDYQVFVSHATADKWIARLICEKLELAGATTFRDDRDINGGDDIPEEIRRQLKRSKEVVVLLTPKSVGREWVRLEIGGAWLWSKKLRITVVLYHIDVDPIPTMLKSKRAIQLNELDDYFDDVSKRAAKYHEDRKK